MIKHALSEASLPRGFRFAATACGLKKTGALDLAILSSDVPASAAAVFTQNLVVAAPVLISKEHLRASKGHMSAVVVNAGNANCATGAAGHAAALRTVAEAAKRLGCTPQELFVCSTGVIGVPLPLEKILRALPVIARHRRPSARSFAELSLAICTTDTRPKTAAVSFMMAGKRIHLVGCAKGAGMIHPNMATMLAFMVTDAIWGAGLPQFLRVAAADTFNKISIDGDTSTNDTFLLLANGASGLKPAGKDAGLLQHSILGMCSDLAQQILADGEGVTRVFKLLIRGAASDEEAMLAARTITTSNLVKTAIHGADPNWGRILAAAGRSGAKVDQTKATVRIGDVNVFESGAPRPFDRERIREIFSTPGLRIAVDLGVAKGKGEAWGTDLSEEYVRINADYTT